MWLPQNVGTNGDKFGTSPVVLGQIQLSQPRMVKLQPSKSNNSNTNSLSMHATLQLWKEVWSMLHRHCSPPTNGVILHLLKVNYINVHQELGLGLERRRRLGVPFHLHTFISISWLQWWQEGSTPKLEKLGMDKTLGTITITEGNILIVKLWTVILYYAYLYNTKLWYTHQVYYILEGRQIQRTWCIRKKTGLPLTLNWRMKVSA